MAILLCLDIKHRVAYILGEIFEPSSNETCDILEISKENFRKRLSRARKEVIEFTSRTCGVIDKKNLVPALKK